MKPILPVLLGADLNAYNVARAFHEAYGAHAQAFGRYPIGVTQNVRILTFEAVPDLDTDDVMVERVNRFASEHPDASLILLGCTDDYVAMIIRCRDRLDARYTVPYISCELLDSITRKDHFYECCERMGIPYPKTVVVHPGEKPEVPFSYPVIIKPSYSVSYWKHPFDGMKKVYTVHNAEEAQSIIDRIFAAGYPDNLILQDRIPGDDSHMYTLTAYVDEEHRVRMMCLGHVLLEEHTPKGLGNHAAIVTECNAPIMEKLRAFLEEISYTGFANFDIKYDDRDGSFRVFEINVRQGRSNYYVTAAGCNIARYLVEDRLEHKPFDGCYLCDRPVYWRYIPDSVVYRYTPETLCRRVRALKKAGQAYSSMRYKPDLRWNLRRRIFVAVHEYHHRKKFKKYYFPERMNEGCGNCKQTEAESRADAQETKQS